MPFLLCLGSCVFVWSSLACGNGSSGDQSLQNPRCNLTLGKAKAPLSHCPYLNRSRIATVFLEKLGLSRMSSPNTCQCLMFLMPKKQNRSAFIQSKGKNGIPRSRSIQARPLQMASDRSTAVRLSNADNCLLFAGAQLGDVHRHCGGVSDT